MGREADEDQRCDKGGGHGITQDDDPVSYMDSTRPSNLEKSPVHASQASPRQSINQSINELMLSHFEDH